jgi:hypothetical protein
MTLVPAQRTDEVAEGRIELIQLTHEEWVAEALAELADLGLTYQEIEEQARDRDFVSYDAQCWWLIYHGTL